MPYFGCVQFLPVTAMRHRHPQPGNPDEFEDFCVRYYRHLLQLGGLTRYAKGGQKQYGIDIIDQLAREPIVAIQCKLREPTKPITPQEIKFEVASVASSSHRIGKYIIATTAKKTRMAQDTVVELNQNNDGSRRFEVEIHFWEEICTRLTEFGRAVADFLIYGEPLADDSVKPISHASTGTPALAADSVDDTDAATLYSEINALFVQRKLEAAEHEINKLPDPEQEDSLSANVRYALLRLRAKLALDTQQYDESARLFYLAYETLPALPQARQNRVLALELSGNRVEAHREAVRLLDDGIRSPFLVSLLIRNASSSTELLPYQAVIDGFTSSEEDVNLALITQYLHWNEPALAEDAARRAVGIAPKSAHALFSWGMVNHHVGVNGAWEDRNRRLEEADRSYSEAISSAERDAYNGLLPEIHMNRGRVLAALGRPDEAAREYRMAVDASSTPHLYAESAVSFFLHEQDFESAYSLVDSLDTKSDEAAFLVAVTNYHRTPNDKKRDHIAEFVKLADRPFGRASEVRFLCVQWCIELKDVDLARQCVPDSYVKTCPFQGNTLLGWVALEDGDTESAQAYSAAALDSNSQNADRQEVRVLTTLLIRLGEDERALPLLEHAAVPGVFDEQCKCLIMCAQRLHRHDVLLRVCSELRETGQQDNQIRKLETDLLSHYLPEKAFALATEFRQYDAPYFSAVRNFLAVRLGKIGEISFDEAPLGLLDAIGPEESHFVITPLLEVGRYRDAIGFAYQQLRRTFDAEHAHGQYAWLVLKYRNKAEIPHPVDVVDGECAILLRNVTTAAERWVVIEDDRPDLARQEIASSAPAAVSLIGKRRGDLVNLRGASVHVQQEEVEEIQSKYVRLFQDVVSHFQERFPGANAIQTLHLGSGDNFDPTPIVQSLAERRNGVAEALQFYSAHLCSLYSLAEHIGVNERRLLIALAQNERDSIECVKCTAEEYVAIGSAHRAVNRVVLELSAIVTLSRLDAWHRLGRNIEHIVSRRTLDRIIMWSDQLNEEAVQPAGFVNIDDAGKIVLQEVTAEVLEQERAELRYLVDRIREVCTVKDSVSMVSMDPKRREQCARAIGRHSLEAVCIAEEEGGVLWTDDFVVGRMCENDFAVKRVWTQLVFKDLEQQGELESAKYSMMSAKLAAWKYVATFVTPPDLIAAGEMCEWDATAWPLKECLKTLRTCHMSWNERAHLAMEVFQLLRRSDCHELKQTGVIQAVLDAIDSGKAVRWMVGCLAQYFRVDYRSERFLREEMLYWLNAR